MELELAQALGLLMLHRAHVLHQVQLDLGGVIAHGTVVIAGLRVDRTLLLLQVLKEREGPLAQGFTLPGVTDKSHPTRATTPHPHPDAGIGPYKTPPGLYLKREVIS